MATNRYTTTYLIESLKRRGMLLSSAEALTDADFLAFADEELQSYVVPLLMSVREEYLVFHKDVTVVAGTAAYAIPERAIGGKLRNVLLSDGNGFTPVSRQEPEQTDGAISSSGPDGYRLESNSVVLSPIPAAGETLRLQHFRRPSRLVPVTEAGLITEIDRDTGVITCNIPDGFVLSELFDFVKGKSGFECLAIDLTATDVDDDPLGITFDPEDIPASLEVGDFVTLAQESPIPQIPVELHPLLAQRVVVRALEANGDPKVGKAEETADRMRQQALLLLTPRAEGSSRYVINRNGPGFGPRTLRWRG